ncbi:ATP-binding protein [Roseinatronobacter sp.]|uniref:ATP-binding protein n=1 Tax=Roseinatronobacter sp. TaxID=1945755 RepID=UPI0025D1728E|nr:ATP-binding protein [Roseibaca sp.]
MSTETSIETGVGATLSLVCAQTVAGAEMAVLRGAVGVGKSFALDRIAAQMTEQGVLVVKVTATEATAGNVNAFLRAILGPYFTETGSGSEAEEAVWRLLQGYPFTSGGPKVLLIVDEAQKLAGRVLETIRGLWDRGDAARLGDETAPCFGCVLVGNPTFMGKGGAQRTASFEPLLSRLSFNMILPRPSRSEFRAFAATLFQDEARAEALVDGGLAYGHFRAPATAARSAKLLAGDGEVTVAHIRQAFKMMGGKA